jgi:hypothetical protein
MTRIEEMKTNSAFFEKIRVKTKENKQRDEGMGKVEDRMDGCDRVGSR